MDSLSFLGDLIARARRAGADAADAVLFEGASLAHAQRLGRIEKLERSESYDLGLRVFIGRRQASVSSNERDPARVGELVERAIAMARAVPEDPYCGLAPEELLARSWPDLDLADPVEPEPELLIARAAAAEDAARAVPGVTNSEGAEASWSRSSMALAASNGFSGTYSGTGHGVSVAVLAGEGSEMERDYDYSSAVHGSDLEDAATVGRRAGERTVKRLHARKVATCKCPVVYDPRVAGSLLRHLVGAISGPSVARGTSFLKDRLGAPIFAHGTAIIDDPHKRRGLRSKPFDGEGVANRRRAIVADGRLETWILDLASARQLGLSSTGHASRGTSGPPGPSPSNLWLDRGTLSPKELMADIESGFYVAELMGMGVSGVTGDYSRGAAGFWIEKGAIAYPVSELTIAGNLKDMFLNLTAANDLVFRTGLDSPTVRIEGMTVAGA
ncbi:MAG TPA: metallopeptidase TldD-related protein [Stellaceae bacterium]|nr:metallopeptidase TldD-related protein [Stellaceae bacterium]